eukprot:GHVP01061010.1.p1 GENE.GHVP01061010.1~~GHVP01061010.1.p1  ORF type:complete len:201 (+),score=38.49 GHVP01061010.1:81-683(+)
MAPKSEVIAGLAGTFMTAVSGGSSNSTSFETNEALCSSPSENFSAHVGSATKEESNEESTASSSLEKSSKLSQDAFAGKVLRKMGISDESLWPKLQSKLKESYVLLFEGKDLAKHWNREFDGLDQTRLYHFNRIDDDDSWPERIQVLLEDQKAKFVFSYSDVEQISTELFEYETLDEVNNVIEKIKNFDKQAINERTLAE